MIVTLTANPSLDRTVDLKEPLLRGAVQRAHQVSEHPGGKGVNVTRTLTASGSRSLAVFPASEDDPLLEASRRHGIPHDYLPIATAVRSNVTLTEPDGTTTKVNVPGPTLDPAELKELNGLLLKHAESASWIVLAGSLPSGAPATFYADILRAAPAANTADTTAHQSDARREIARPRIAVDTSGGPLSAAVEGPVLPDLLKPNAEELASLVTEPDNRAKLAKRADLFEHDPYAAVDAARELVDRGVGTVLATLGAQGAVLVTKTDSWHAANAPISARSTVGAGDSALAGFLLADEQHADPADCLRQAVAHGVAAAGLPGTGVPPIDATRPDDVLLKQL